MYSVYLTCMKGRGINYNETSIKEEDRSYFFSLLLGLPQGPNSIPELWHYILKSSGLNVFKNQQRETSIK